MIEYALIREIECSEPCAIYFTENLTRTARIAIDYSNCGISLKLQVKIDGRYATPDELDEHTRLVEEKIEELSNRVQQ